MADEDLLNGAKRIAADLVLPGGRPLKLAKIIEPHLGWFIAARRRGLEWDDIIDLLFEAGVKRPNGMRLSRGHLSSLVPRKIEQAKRTTTSRTRAASSQRQLDRPHEPPGASVQEARKLSRDARPVAEQGAHQGKAGHGRRRTNTPQEAPVSSPRRAGPADSGQAGGTTELLRRMERAARARRHSDDP